MNAWGKNKQLKYLLKEYAIWLTKMAIEDEFISQNLRRIWNFEHDWVYIMIISTSNLLQNNNTITAKSLI